MITKTYLTKFNTIISNSKLNTGLNPISELVYGKDFIVSRSLKYFDHNKVKELINNGIMVDMTKMKHILHITNAGSLDLPNSMIVRQVQLMKTRRFVQQVLTLYSS